MNPLGQAAFEVVGLWIYPVKSLAGTPVPRVQLHAHGCAGDREWAVVNARGEVTWQGAIPRMALIQPELTERGLLLRGLGLPPLVVAREARRSPCEVMIWNDELRRAEAFPCEDAGAEARDWLSDGLGQPLRLVRLGEAARRRSALNPLHLVSTATLRALDTCLAERGVAPVSVERLRPNLLLDFAQAGSAEPEAELTSFHWTSAEGTAALQVSKPCVRCVMPNIDLRNAQVQREPLATIVRMRAARGDDSPWLGVYARVLVPGPISHGQRGSGALLRQ